MINYEPTTGENTLPRLTNDFNKELIAPTEVSHEPIAPEASKTLGNYLVQSSVEYNSEIDKSTLPGRIVTSILQRNIFRNIFHDRKNPPSK